MPQSAYKAIYQCPRWARFPTALRDMCYAHNLTLDIQVEKHWLSETVRYTITGPDHKVKAMKKAINKTIREYNL